MTEIVAIITLAILVLAQLVERYLYSKQMTQKLSEALKAVMSRNINEFILATEADKAPQKDFTENDQVSLDEVGEEAFDNFIAKQNKSE